MSNKTAIGDFDTYFLPQMPTAPLGDGTTLIGKINLVAGEVVAPSPTDFARMPLKQKGFDKRIQKLLNRLHALELNVLALRAKVAESNVRITELSQQVQGYTTPIKE